MTRDASHRPGGELGARRGVGPGSGESERRSPRLRPAGIHATARASRLRVPCQQMSRQSETLSPVAGAKGWRERPGRWEPVRDGRVPGPGDANGERVEPDACSLRTSWTPDSPGTQTSSGVPASSTSSRGVDRSPMGARSRARVGSPSASRPQTRCRSQGVTRLWQSGVIPWIISASKSMHGPIDLLPEFLGMGPVSDDADRERRVSSLDIADYFGREEIDDPGIFSN